MAETTLEKMPFNITETAEFGDSGNTIENFFNSTPSSEDQIEQLSEEEKKTGVVNKTVPKKEVPKKPVVEKKEEQDDDEEEGEEENPLEDLFGEEGSEENEEGEEDDDENKEDSSKNNPFSSITKELFKLNIFTKEEGEGDVEIKTPEEFKARWELEAQRNSHKAINQFISQFGEDYQHAFQSIFVNGVDPKEYFGVYNEIQDLSEVDVEQEMNQIAIVRQTLQEQGMASEDISAEIERIKNYGDLLTVAQRYQKVLIRSKANKLAEVERQNAEKLQLRKEAKALYMKNVQSVLQEKLKQNDFDGIPINPKLAQELQDFLVTEKYKNSSGQTLTDFDKLIYDLNKPENHVKKVKVALLLKTLEKDPTLSTLQKAAVSKKTDSLFGELVRKTSKEAVKSSKKKTEAPSPWFK